MKIKYEFANEAIEIEVTEDWENLLIDLDRQEYNVNQRETRRHVTLDGMEYEGKLFADDTDMVEDFIKEQDAEIIRNVISGLLPQQKELVKKVFFEECSIASIAREENVSETAVRNRLKKIYVQMKKSFI